MSAATEFAAELDAYGVGIEVEALELKREVSLELFHGVVVGTPVGNPRRWKHKAPKGYVGGFHRGSWQLTSGDPAEGVVERRSGEAAISEAESVKQTLEDTTWVTNNGPAITRLEFAGHSSQAPDGWARAVVERVKAVHGAD